MYELEGILNVWIELYLAYEKRNGFGTDTAEIYFYPFVTKAMEINKRNDEYREIDIMKIHTILYNLFSMFEVKYECSLYIDGRELGTWFIEHDTNTHRMHVRVVTD